MTIYIYILEVTWLEVLTNSQESLGALVCAKLLPVIPNSQFRMFQFADRDGILGELIALA